MKHGQPVILAAVAAQSPIQLGVEPDLHVAQLLGSVSASARLGGAHVRSEQSFFIGRRLAASRLSGKDAQLIDLTLPLRGARVAEVCGGAALR